MKKSNIFEVIFEVSLTNFNQKNQKKQEKQEKQRNREKSVDMGAVIDYLRIFQD